MAIDWSITSSVVTALTTVVYTAGTFLLWATTRKSVRLIGEQIKAQERQIRSAANSQIISSHRELFLTIIKDDILLDALSPNSPDTRKAILASMLINHCWMIYEEYSSGTLPADDMPSFIDDAVDLFNYKIVRLRWEKVRNFHDKKFVRFVSENIIPRLDLYK